MAKSLQNQNDHKTRENRSLKSRQFKGIRMRKWEMGVRNANAQLHRKNFAGLLRYPGKGCPRLRFCCVLPERIESQAQFSPFPAGIPCASALSLPQIKALAAKFATEELQLSSEATFLSSGPEAESCNEYLKIWAENSPAFWDWALLQCLESGKFPNLNEFPSLDESMEYFGVKL